MAAQRGTQRSPWLLVAEVAEAPCKDIHTCLVPTQGTQCAASLLLFQVWFVSRTQWLCIIHLPGTYISGGVHQSGHALRENLCSP
jgi:hypothetical protein